jgi:hypothetical protein
VNDAYFLPIGKTGAAWSAFADHSIATFAPLFGWVNSPTVPDVIYIVEDEPSSGGDQFLIYSGAGVFRPLGVLTGDASSIWYAAEWGDDAASGRDPNDPMRLVQIAIDAAEAAGPTQAGPNSVVVLDAERHVEDLTVPSFVNVFMPFSVLAGDVDLEDQSSFNAHIHEGSIDRVTGSTGEAFYKVDRQIGAVTNTVSGSVLVVAIGQAQIIDTSAIGLSLTTAGASIRGRIASLRDQGAATTTGIVVSNGTCDLAVGAIEADTAYNVSGGTLRLSCISITGTQTHSGGTLVRDLLTDGSRPMTGDLDLDGNDLDLGGGGILEDGAAAGDVMVHDGTRYVGETPTGTSFPGTPREGQKFYRTDLEEEFYFDSSRSKWLSVRTHCIKGFASANNTAPVYLFVNPAVPYAAAIGWVCPWDCIVVEFSALVMVSSTCTFSVRDDGTDVTGGSLALSSQQKLASDSINSNTIASGSTVSLALTAGSFTGGCLVYATFRRVET